ncbi:hypothetical protein E1B28_004865 [Marasmius oreades]|uniref:Uncharacterized protein n=1 Tax=Marasmius oreades TaxID=181124 RepID=A0A9P7UZI4_9AGAR|nr:uncharacterized protein E1B28_004865 [Marasmius oreades]KAG7097522.1 hypothetical protein E1B28_004865 [Marasmius oreades]
MVCRVPKKQKKCVTPPSPYLVVTLKDSFPSSQITMYNSPVYALYLLKKAATAPYPLLQVTFAERCNGGQDEVIGRQRRQSRGGCWQETSKFRVESLDMPTGIGLMSPQQALGTKPTKSGLEG